MRNPDRIPVILEKIRRAWEAAPDLRFNQLLGGINSPCCADIETLLMEDDTFEKKLDNWNAKNNHSTRA